jgi:hypothetical protein
MSAMKELAKITKDNCDFPTLRQSGCTYVDKTAWLVKLATDVQSRMYFLARPRRFGKSLMISTLKAMFEGRKELFKYGLFDLGVPDEEVRQDLSALMTDLVSNRDVLWAVNVAVK